MAIFSKAKLIPRNNWDYNVSDTMKALSAAIRKTSYGGESFEKFFGQRPIFTTSGRTSLYAILKSLNLPEGACIGVPLFCCDVVFDAIKKANLTPKFIDINTDDYNLSASDLEKKVIVHPHANPPPSRGREQRKPSVKGGGNRENPPSRGTELNRFAEKYSPSTGGRGLGGGGAELLQKKKDSLSAVIVVHMFGHPADMDAISAVCGKIPVIEDCAHSLFSKYKGRYTGLLSSASFFSFRSGKYISAGEGSAIFTKDPSLKESISRLVETFDKKKLHQEILHCTSTYIKSTLYKRPLYGTIGFPIGKRLDQKFNLTAKAGFEAAQIAKSDLKIINDRIETFLLKIKKQRENALFLLERIKLKNVVLPREKKGCHSNYYQFAIRFEDTARRDLMSEYLFKNGIDTAKYLNNIVDMAKEQYGYDGDCPSAEKAAKTVLIIPNHYTLSGQDMDRIVRHLNEGLSV